MGFGAGRLAVARGGMPNFREFERIVAGGRRRSRQQRTGFKLFHVPIKNHRRIASPRLEFHFTLRILKSTAALSQPNFWPRGRVPTQLGRTQKPRLISWRDFKTYLRATARSQRHFTLVKVLVCAQSHCDKAVNWAMSDSGSFHRLSWECRRRLLDQESGLVTGSLDAMQWHKQRDGTLNSIKCKSCI